MNTLPDEIIFMHIFPRILDWYPTIAASTSRMRELIKKALIFNYKSRQKKKSKDVLIKNRHLTLLNLADDCVELYPNVMIWQCENGYVYNYQRYYHKCLYVENYTLAEFMLDKLKFVNGHTMDLTIKYGTTELVEKAIVKHKGPDNYWCDLAAANNRHEILKKLVDMEYEHDQNTGRLLIQNRHFELLEWWINRNLPCFKRTHDAAKELLIIPSELKWYNPNKRQRKN